MNMKKYAVKILAPCVLTFACVAAVTPLWAQADFTETKRLSITGFMDVLFSNIWMKENNLDRSDTPTKSRTVVNNLNLYFLFKVHQDWLAFSEIRYLHYPAGTSDVQAELKGDPIPTALVTTKTPIITKQRDAIGNITDYGSINIERAYIEWNHFELASFRAGKYLTPFGIWSQDHGSPAVTSVRTPVIAFSYNMKLGMPYSQTGMEFFGKLNMHSLNLNIDYAAYVGNGISDADMLDDERDEKKSFGGFINFSFMGLADIIDLELGFSAYRGDRSMLGRQVKTEEVSLTGSLDTDKEIVNYWFNKQIDTIYFAHAKLSIMQLPFDGMLVIQTELTRQYIDEEKGANFLIETDIETAMVANMAGTRAAKSYHAQGLYAQVEYQFFYRVTPYYRYEYYHLNPPDVMLKKVMDKLTMHKVGLRYTPIPSVAIKAEYSRNLTEGTENDTEYQMLYTSVSIAF